MYVDSQGLSLIWGVITNLFAGKVDKVEGKALSTNDYTTEEKNKLSDIASGAEVNVLEGVSVNGTALSITGKVADVTVPTNNNQLTNGAGYQTATDVTNAINANVRAMTAEEINAIIAS